MGDTKLVLGAGKRPVAGWTNIDIVAGPGINMIWDVTNIPWPFEDSSVSEIQSSDFLEHLGWESGRDHFVAVLNECWRVLRPGGKASHRCPLGGTEEAHADPTHRRQIFPRTWRYFDHTNEIHTFNGVDYGIKPWKILDLRIAKLPIHYVDVVMTPVKG